MSVRRLRLFLDANVLHAAAVRVDAGERYDVAIMTADEVAATLVRG